MLGSDRDRCDSCGVLAPDVVGPVLIGLHGWREFTIDGVDDARGPWEAHVLLCDDPNGHIGWRQTGKGCASRMQAFLDSGGRDGVGPTPPHIQTCKGGRDKEPSYAVAA